MGAGASSMGDEIVVGDVVTIKLEGHEQRVIGLVSTITDGNYSVQVSNTQILEDIQRDALKRIMSWNEIEVNDIVKVQSNGSQLYYEAKIISRNEDNTFNVQFGGDEQVEENIPKERIFKLMSGRLGQQEWLSIKQIDEEGNISDAPVKSTATSSSSSFSVLEEETKVEI